MSARADGMAEAGGSDSESGKAGTSGSRSKIGKAGSSGSRPESGKAGTGGSRPENGKAEASVSESESGKAEAGKSGSESGTLYVLARRIGRIAAAALAALLLVYYCLHPALYAEGDQEILLYASWKTYAVMAASLVLIVLALLPVRLEGRTRHIVSWCWFAAAPFAVYFSLLYLNAEKFDIHFFELNRIALGLTFLFLFLLETAFFVLTGSIRFAVVVMAVLIAVLGIANRFVISFRGMALSAGDLFSIGAAASVASEYTYKIDWYIFAEVVLTFAICMVSVKLGGGRVLRPAVRLAVLGLWCVLTGGYYHLCCRTDFLEEHEIRSTGFTHQLRYKNYDMIFTTLTTCFYLSVDKPEGYSVKAVKELAEPYLADAAGEGGAAAGNGTDCGQSAVAVGSGQTGGQSAAAAGNGTDSGQSAAAAGSSQTDGQSAAAAGNGTDSGSSAVAVGNGQTGGQAGDAGVQPNVIVIMNESFADYTEIGRGLTLSEDCMPFVRSLSENTIKGYAYTSIFGGNTPNSEYEFLTGNTMGFLPESSVGFNLFVRGNLPSLASQFKSQGYNTLAIHPYRGTNYRRHIVYPQIGFDTYYTRTDFEEPYYIRNFISDEELADRIILEFDKNKETGKPLFSYNVTVQNHGDYFASNTRNLDLSIEVKNQEVNQTKTQIYVNLIRESDRAFEKLVEHFEQEAEPTVILMFGDHQANLGDNTYRYLIGAEEELTPEERMEKYKVPFVAWANYDIPEETVGRTSLNYLYSILADRLDLPMTGYQKYLLDLSSKIPVLCAQGYWTADGSFYELDDAQSPCYEEINSYNILEYNDILGGNDRYLKFFAEVQDG